MDERIFLALGNRRFERIGVFTVSAPQLHTPARFFRVGDRVHGLAANGTSSSAALETPYRWVDGPLKPPAK
jgi:hypothetical protein